MKAHWQTIYPDKAPGDLSWHQSEPSLLLQLIHRCRTARDEAVIDVDDGASLPVDCLAKEGFKNLAVLDISGQTLSL